MFTLRALYLCLSLWPRLHEPPRSRCLAAAEASLAAAETHKVDPATLLAIGWRESRWSYQRSASGACGAWQVVGVDCGSVRDLPAAADAGARVLAAWQRAAARRHLPERRAVAAYACGWSGLRGRGCRWYSASVSRMTQGVNL